MFIFSKFPNMLVYSHNAKVQKHNCYGLVGLKPCLLQEKNKSALSCSVLFVIKRPFPLERKA